MDYLHNISHGISSSNYIDSTVDLTTDKPSGKIALHIVCDPSEDHNNAIYADTKTAELAPHLIRAIGAQVKSGEFDQVKILRLGKGSNLKDLEKNLHYLKINKVQIESLHIHAHGSTDKVALERGPRGRLTIPFGKEGMSPKGRAVNQSKKIISLMKDIMRRNGSVNFHSCNVGAKLTESISKKLKRNIKVIGSDDLVCGVDATKSGKLVNMPCQGQSKMKSLEFVNGKLESRIFSKYNPDWSAKAVRIPA